MGRAKNCDVVTALLGVPYLVVQKLRSCMIYGIQEISTAVPIDVVRYLQKLLAKSNLYQSSSSTYCCVPRLPAQCCSLDEVSFMFVGDSHRCAPGAKSPSQHAFFHSGCRAIDRGDILPGYEVSRLATCKLKRWPVWLLGMHATWRAMISIVASVGVLLSKLKALSSTICLIADWT